MSATTTEITTITVDMDAVTRYRRIMAANRNVPVEAIPLADALADWTDYMFARQAYRAARGLD